MTAIFVGILMGIMGQSESRVSESTPWTSPDGAVSAVIPGGFQTSGAGQDGQGGFQGIRWVDEKTGSVIAAYLSSVPPSMSTRPFNMNEITKGFNDAVVSSMSGRLVQSSWNTVDGFPTATMTVESSLSDIVVKQRMIVTSQSIYVVGATGTANAQKEDPRLQDFINSLKVNAGKAVPPSSKPVRQAQPAAPANQWDKIGGQIGFGGIVLLVVCFVLSRQAKQKSRN